MSLDRVVRVWSSSKAGRSSHLLYLRKRIRQLVINRKNTIETR